MMAIPFSTSEAYFGNADIAQSIIWRVMAAINMARIISKITRIQLFGFWLFTKLAPFLISPKVRFWPNSAVRVSLANCRAGKVIDCVDRQLSTQTRRLTASHFGFFALDVRPVGAVIRTVRRQPGSRRKSPALRGVPSAIAALCRHSHYQRRQRKMRKRRRLKFL